MDRHPSITRIWIHGKTNTAWMSAFWARINA